MSDSPSPFIQMVLQFSPQLLHLVFNAARRYQKMVSTKEENNKGIASPPGASNANDAARRADRESKIGQEDPSRLQASLQLIKRYRHFSSLSTA
jgi:hypothetical protein